MTLKALIRKLKDFRPTSVDEFEQATGLKLILVGSGCFREVFCVEGRRLVIKFPMMEESRVSINHSRREIRRMKQIMQSKRYRHMRRYVPTVFYSDYANGVVMLPLLHRVGKVSKSATTVIKRMVNDTFPCVCGHGDTTHDNLGYDGRGQIKILDWGCV